MTQQGNQGGQGTPPTAPPPVHPIFSTMQMVPPQPGTAQSIFHMVPAAFPGMQNGQATSASPHTHNFPWLPPVAPQGGQPAAAPQQTQTSNPPADGQQTAPKGQEQGTEVQSPGLEQQVLQLQQQLNQQQQLLMQQQMSGWMQGLGLSMQEQQQVVAMAGNDPQRIQMAASYIYQQKQQLAAQQEQQTRQQGRGNNTATTPANNGQQNQSAGLQNNVAGQTQLPAIPPLNPFQVPPANQAQPSQMGVQSQGMQPGLFYMQTPQGFVPVTAGVQPPLPPPPSTDSTTLQTGAGVGGGEAPKSFKEARQAFLNS